ncbi:MAG: fused signal recognition particle receptor [Verrucomicrobiales bacterium]|jgi:fused signal recognition particle receptor
MGLFNAILKRFKNKKVDWDDLEEMLVTADLGAPLAMQILDDLQDLGRTLKTDDVLGVCRDHITRILPETTPTLEPFDGKPRVVLVAGVNGTGKTTSTAKLAHLLKKQGHSVMVAAADTFRAAAIEQLTVWAERLDIPIIKTQYQGDPSAVCFDAYEAAASKGIQFLLCDTAGRLHTRSNLMEELKKVRRTLAKKDEAAPHDRIVVVDATTGSNALAQAKEFHAALDLTGLIITKLDGSGKGGMAVAIQQQLGIPTLYVGTGEAAEDFNQFESDHFVEQML